MNPAVLMGDPTYFRIAAGPNPFTRNLLGLRKRVNRQKAIRQWHALAQLLTKLGVEVYIIPPAPEVPGLVYPANAGIFAPDGTFVLSNLLPARAAETPHYEQFLTGLGLKTSRIAKRFEGEADLFPVGEKMIFTYGELEEQRFIWRWGLPPWKRVYGFRSELGAFEELQKYFPQREIITAQLRNESFYHGDTAFCSFGPGRTHLLAYLEAVTDASRIRLQQIFKNQIVELSREDGALYSANSFYFETQVHKTLVMPEGVSRSLIEAVTARGVQPVLIDVSEFWKKGGGSVKCMIGTLGFLPKPATEAIQSFRQQHLYRTT